MSLPQLVALVESPGCDAGRGTQAAPLPANSLSLVRGIGSLSRTMWLDVSGLNTREEKAGEKEVGGGGRENTFWRFAESSCV